MTNESKGFVILNKSNGLLWSARDKRHVGLRGNFTTYASAARAQAALRRTGSLRHFGDVVGRIEFNEHGMAPTVTSGHDFLTDQ
jgi:hypothetical protein